MYIDDIIGFGLRKKLKRTALVVPFNKNCVCDGKIIDPLCSELISYYVKPIFLQKTAAKPSRKIEVISETNDL